MQASRSQRVPPLFFLLAIVLAVLVGVAIPLKVYGQEALDPCACVCPVEVSIEEIAKGTAIAVIGLVFIVEGLRVLVPPWRRRRGAQLSDRARLALGVLVVGLAEALAFAGVAPAVRPGPVATVFSGIVVAMAAISLNELVWKGIVGRVRDRIAAKSDVGGAV